MTRGFERAFDEPLKQSRMGLASRKPMKIPNGDSYDREFHREMPPLYEQGKISYSNTDPVDSGDQRSYKIHPAGSSCQEKINLKSLVFLLMPILRRTIHLILVP